MERVERVQVWRSYLAYIQCSSNDLFASAIQKNHSTLVYMAIDTVCFLKVFLSHKIRSAFWKSEKFGKISTSALIRCYLLTFCSISYFGFILRAIYGTICILSGQQILFLSDEIINRSDPHETRQYL